MTKSGGFNATLRFPLFFLLDLLIVKKDCTASVYFKLNLSVCTSRLLGPTMMLKSPGSHLYSSCWL